MPDNRPIWKARIGGVVYEFHEPNAEEITRAEREILEPYIPFMQTAEPDDPVPATYTIDMKYNIIMAAILSPKLTAKMIREMPRKHFTALRNTLTQKLRLDEQDDVFFLQEPDRASSSNPRGVRHENSQVADRQNVGARVVVAPKRNPLAEQTEQKDTEELRAQV